MKMKEVLALCLVSCSMVFSASAARAATIGLAEMAFNVDGSISSHQLPSGSNDSGFDTNSGLGTLTWSTSITGYHTFIAFFDLEIDNTNENGNTFFNEYGSVMGTSTVDQTWEIDEPGYVYGDIYDNLLSGALDNSNGVPSTVPDDVSFALGWDFLVEQGSTATITLNLSEGVPASGFYLVQTDPDSNANVYFSSSLDISPTAVPEPSSLLLLLSGLSLAGGAGMFGRRARKAFFRA